VQEWGLSRITFGHNEGHLVDATFHTRPVSSPIIDDPNLMSCASLIPMVGADAAVTRLVGQLDDLTV
jgi:hypothetical protein